jgi:hypothetical protein
LKFVYLLSLLILACNPVNTGIELLHNGGFDDYDLQSGDPSKKLPFWRPISCGYDSGEIYILDVEERSLLLMSRMDCGIVTSEYYVPAPRKNYTITINSRIIIPTNSNYDYDESSGESCPGVDVLLTWFAPDIDKWGVGSTHHLCSFGGKWMNNEFYGSVPPWATSVRLALLQNAPVLTYLDDVSLVIHD